MKVRILYVTVTGGDRTEAFARRFGETWDDYPPDYPYHLTVICNGGPASYQTGMWLKHLEPTFYPRPNVGADIGAFMDVARQDDSDAILCLGESVYFHRRGWLQRIAQVWENLREPGLYGFFSSNLVNPHLNTTAFLCPPKMLAAYPEIVVTRDQRYAFEHGSRPFWKRVQGLGLPVRLITWDGDYSPGEWRAPNNILWKGDQSNCLFWCIHTDRYSNADPTVRRNWEKHANIGL